MELTIK
jgi:hypothetical protein